MKRYELRYWDYDSNDDKQALFNIEVLASDETIQSLMSEHKRQFYKFIINDGEEYIIDVDSIHSLTSIREVS